MRIETTVTTIKCDGCDQIIPSGVGMYVPSSINTRAFDKDFCPTCTSRIFEDVSQSGKLSEEDFQYILNDYKMSYNRPIPGVMLC